MIYKNFLLFISAIILYAFGPIAPVSSIEGLSPLIQLYGIILLLLGFWQYNRHKFLKLKSDIDENRITLGEAKKRYLYFTNLHMITAIVIFAIEIFLFHLKYFLVQIPLLGRFDIFINTGGICFFILHLAMIWYWSYRGMKDVIPLGKSASDHVEANIKFNLVIVIPWLFISLLWDLLKNISSPELSNFLNSLLGQMLVFVFFIVILTIYAPLFIKSLWECKPFKDFQLKKEIEDFCHSQGVKFKQILSWNALNGGLVTAAVLGLIARFRYLLITPELISILNKDELLGVVSHEVGHVKKKHLLYYMFFFLGFIFIWVSTMQFITILLMKMPSGWGISFQDDGISQSLPVEIIGIVISIFLFILYFRFIFGYFMRNFEREADIYCFHSGVNPEYLISSFEKLNINMGGEEKKSNWHHFTISQRIGFLKKCINDSGQIKVHEKKLKNSLKLYMTALIIFGSFTVSMFVMNPNLGFENIDHIMVVLEKKIEANPEKPELYFLLGQLSYALEKWQKAKEAFESSLDLKYQQPETLNNLAWLLLKCPDEKYLNPKRALILAKDAVKYSEKSYHILDTLAEAYFQNSLYKEAFLTAQKAFLLATENHDYYQKQLEKMGKYYKKFKNAIDI